METNGHWLLLGGIRSLLRCDDAEVVHGIANYVLSQHSVVRRMAHFVERSRGTLIPPVFAVLGWLRAFLAVSLPQSFDGVAWVARLSNERRALEELMTLAPELGWTELKLKSTPTLSRGLIYPIDDNLKLNLDAMTDFYRRPDWLKVFNFFANVNDDKHSILAQAVSLMCEVLPQSPEIVAGPGQNRNAVASGRFK